MNCNMKRPTDLRIGIRGKARAAAPPCPHLRADEPEHAQPEALRAARERQIEVGRVDQHHEIGALLAQRARHAPPRPRDAAEVAQHFDEPTDRELALGHEDARAGGFERCPPEREHLELRHARAERSDRGGGVHLARGVARAHEQPHASSASGGMALTTRSAVRSAARP